MRTHVGAKCGNLADYAYLCAVNELKVDVSALLRQRVPGLFRWIPRPLVRALERYVCQRQLNEILDATRGLGGSEFAAGALRQLRVGYDVVAPSAEAGLPAGPVTYVSNHPLGGLDGLCLIDWVARRHGVEPYFVVNDLLSVLSPLGGIFLPVNKYGRQARGGVNRVDEAFADTSRPMIMFPAGLCSRQLRKGAQVRDLRWNKMFVQKSAESGRTVIPLRFVGENSPAFYRLARRRVRLGLKFNLEMIRLPREMVMSAGSVYSIRVGDPIPPSALGRGADAAARAAQIREYVYTL